MTTRKELGEMLITGKPIQESIHGNRTIFEDMDGDGFLLNTRDYRLKPTVTYYRAYLQTLHLDYKSEPFEDYPNPNEVHDFKIEE